MGQAAGRTRTGSGYVVHPRPRETRQPGRPGCLGGSGTAAGRIARLPAGVTRGTPRSTAGILGHYGDDVDAWRFGDSGQARRWPSDHVGSAGGSHVVLLHIDSKAGAGLAVRKILRKVAILKHLLTAILVIFRRRRSCAMGARLDEAEVAALWRERHATRGVVVMDGPAARLGSTP